MMKKIFSKYFMVAVVAVAMGCISSCKDYEDEMYSSLKGDDQELMDSVANLREAIEKHYNAMRDSLQNAREEREALKSALTQHIADAESKYATKNQLKEAKEALEQQLSQTGLQLQGQIDNLRTQMTQADQQLQGKIDELKTQMTQTDQQLQGKIDELKTQMTTEGKKIQDQIDALKAQMTTEDRKLQNQIDVINGNITTLNNELTSVKNDLTSTIVRLGKVEAQVKADSIRINDLEAADVRIEGLIDALENADEKLNARIDSLKGVVEALNSCGCGDLMTTVSGMQTTLNTVSAKTNQVAADATEAKNKAEKNETAITTMQAEIQKIKECTKCDSLANALSELENKVAALAEDVEEAKQMAIEAEKNAKQYAKEYTDKTLDAVMEYVNPKFNGIEQLLAEVYFTVEEHADQLMEQDASIKVLADSITALRTDITKLATRIKANEDAISKLDSRIDKVEEELKDVTAALKQRISSVVLQATKSPVVGYFNIPMGIKSNVLAAYYGEAMNDVYFPTIRTANLISGDAFTEEEAKLLGFTDKVLFEQGGVLIDTVQGNAGTLYMTVNPAEVNLDSVNFALVNSVEDTSYVVLSKPVASSEKLTFGYTRADNGFYEAKATVSAEDAAAAKMRVDLNDVKSLASELKSSVENLNVDFTGIAASIQSIVNDVADATAVRASWSDSMGIHNVYSEYALAAMTVKPLSFQFMQNFEMKNFPGITRVSNFINNAIDKINIALPTFDMDFTAPEIKKIQIKDFDELGVNCIIETTVQYELNMTVPVDDVVIGEQTVVVPGQTISVPVAEQKGYGEINGEKVEVIVPATTVDVVVNGTTVKVDEQVITINDVVVNKTLEIPVKYDMTDIIKDLYGNVTEPIEDVNAMLGDLEEFMDDVNKMLEQLDAINDIEQSITDAKNDIKKELNGYLERLNNKLCGAINSVHDRLQPNMLLKTEDGFAMLSQVENKPTVLEAANCVLVPTTYTGELLVPAFKKYVAVVNVKDAEGNDVTSAEIANVNTGKLNTVLAGSTTDVEFAGKSGYTYEIVYSALDYSGKYSNVRYYVTVK